MLSGKADIIYFHLGSSPTEIDILWQLLNETTIPIRHMYLTHMSSRGEEPIKEARKWIIDGGVCDLTADPKPLNTTRMVDTLNRFRDEKLPLERITISSDASGYGLNFILNYILSHCNKFIFLLLERTFIIQSVLLLFL